MSTVHADDPHAPETPTPSVPAARAPYQPPRLTNYGTMEQLTEGASGPNSDATAVGSH